MNVEAKITVTEDDSKIMVRLSGQNMGLLIGYRGETLDALQYLTNLAINKDSENTGESSSYRGIQKQKRRNSEKTG